MTTIESLKKATETVIEKINALPNTVKTMNENYEFITADITAGKPEMIELLSNIPDFIPAFTEQQNMERILYKASDSAKLAFYNATN